jgi:hypothetical protein
LDADAVVGIALAHDGGRSFFDDLPSDAEPLKVVDPSKIRNLPLKNVRAKVVILRERSALAKHPIYRARRKR